MAHWATSDNGDFASCHPFEHVTALVPEIPDPDAKSAPIADAAHMVIVEQPRRTAELIRSFIARH